jgi:hypothetical protein
MYHGTAHQARSPAESPKSQKIRALPEFEAFTRR